MTRSGQRHRRQADWLRLPTMTGVTGHGVFSEIDFIVGLDGQHHLHHSASRLLFWVWESDDKTEKQTARRMMQMVLSIQANDKVDFRENAVTCYTCHRGQTQPVGLPPMPLARSGHEPGPNDAAPSVRTTSPSVEQIFNKYIEALGGSAATGTKTLALKGRREASQDRNWPNEITLAVPDKFLIVAT